MVVRFTFPPARSVLPHIPVVCQSLSCRVHHCVNLRSSSLCPSPPACWSFLRHDESDSLDLSLISLSWFLCFLKIVFSCRQDRSLWQVFSPVFDLLLACMLKRSGRRFIFYLSDVFCALFRKIFADPRGHEGKYPRIFSSRTFTVLGFILRSMSRN